MVDAVLEAYNDAGRLQFALLAPIPAVVAKGTFTASDNPTGSTNAGYVSSRLEISGLSESAFIAIRPKGALTWVFSYCERVSGVNRYNFHTNGSTASMDWYAFDFPPPGPTSGIIAEMFDATGKLLWQLHSKPAIGAGYLYREFGDGTLGDDTINIPNGRTFAVAIGIRSGYTRYDEIGTPDGQPTRYRYKYLLDTIKISGSTIIAHLDIVDQSGGFTTDPSVENKRVYFGPRNMMILDVTNY